MLFSTQHYTFTWTRTHARTDTPNRNQTDAWTHHQIQINSCNVNTYCDTVNKTNPSLALTSLPIKICLFFMFLLMTLHYAWNPNQTCFFFLNGKHSIHCVCVCFLCAYLHRRRVAPLLGRSSSEERGSGEEGSVTRTLPTVPCSACTAGKPLQSPPSLKK